MHDHPASGVVSAGAGIAARGRRAAFYPQRLVAWADIYRRGRGGTAPTGEGSGPDRPEGKPPRGRVCGGPAETQIRVSPRASFGGNHKRITCGVSTAAVNQGHRVVRLPCGYGHHIINARCVLAVVSSSRAQWGAQAQLVCSKHGCGTDSGRREALDAAVQADAGLRDAAGALRARPEEHDEGYREGFHYRWDQECLTVVEPLDSP